MGKEPNTELAEILRWRWGHNPNPPDPWLGVILELGDQSVRQAAIQGLITLNATTARAQADFWTGLQKAAGGKAGG